MQEGDYVVLGFGQVDYPEEFVVLVHENDRAGLPFHVVNDNMSSSVEQLRKLGKKDCYIVRALGYVAGGNAKFGFYLGMAEGDVHFYLSSLVCYSFLHKYGPQSEKASLIEGKPVRFLVCDEINYQEICEGKPPVYVLSKTNAEGRQRPYVVTDFRNDDFYLLYLKTLEK